MDPFVREHLAPWQATLDEARHLWVGFSGGLDSSVLLHALVSWCGAGRVTAVHVNHGLSPDSTAWREHSLLQAVALGVGFHTETVAVVADGQGVEQAARHQRYRVFENCLQSGDLLLLAHHGDDQAETVLYRLLRGSGPKGIAAIPVQRQLGRGALLRPLLTASRTDIEDYARRHGLRWIEDESNRSPHFDRNYLRQSVLPAIADRWPDYRQRLARAAAQHRAAQQVLDEVAAQDLHELDGTACRAGWRLALPDFARLSPARQANLLRHWIAAVALPVPGHRVIEEALRVLDAGDDAGPCVAWPGGELRRFRQWLYLCPPQVQADPARVLAWCGDDVIELPDGGNLLAQACPGQGVRRRGDDHWQIRFRQGGERCHPAARGHSSSLKKILQEYGLEPWLRDRVPLLYCNGELAAVADLFVCRGFEAGNGEPGLVLRWQPGNWPGQGG